MTEETDIILQVSNLSRQVNSNGISKKIIDSITYSFSKGKIYSIIGPSGAGKSSFLRLLNRLDEPTDGNIFFQGKDYIEYPPCELRTKIGYLFQEPYLFNGSVKKNLRYVNKGLTENEIEKLILQLQIKMELIDSDVSTLSVGEKQRVALARLLTMQPEVILLDEPTSALDPTYKEAIEQSIKKIIREFHTTVIFVSHSPEQALRMGGVGLLLVDGKLIESAPIEKLVNEPQSEQGKLYKSRQLI